MTAFTAREVRAWAIANDVPCPTTGKLPRRVIDAYLEAVHGVTGDQADTETTETAEIEDAPFTVDVTIAGHDDLAAEIAQHLVNALWAAFDGGRTSERAAMLVALGGAA